ncbi:MAG: ELWxxDGT repeat protein, partial [Egibacteraceae bacterium]
AAFTIHRDGHVGFTVGDYNPAYPLVIDPTVDYATFLGGSGRDEIRGMAVDDDGAVYVTGSTNSLDFPTTPGAFQQDWPGDDDAVFTSAFVTKLLPGAGEGGAVALEWSTFLGGGSATTVHGGSFDSAGDVFVDDDGVVHMAGITGSSDFPITEDAHDQEPPDRHGKGFVTLLSPDGSQLMHSTYYAERIETMAVDDAGMIYVGEQNAGGVARIDPAAGPGESAVDRIAIGTRFVFSVTVDDHGFVYAIGNRGTFEATAGAYQEEPVGGWLVKLDWGLEGTDRFVYASYGIGGRDIAWNPNHDTVFIAGNFGGALIGDHAFEAPATLGAMQTEHSRFFANHGHDVSIREGTLREFDLAGNGADDQVYATLFGGFWTDEGVAVAATPEGTAWVAGITQSGEFPHVTEDALQPESGFPGRFGHGSAGAAGVLLHIDPAGRGEGDLLYGTTFTGASESGVKSARWDGIDVNETGTVTVAGRGFGPTHNAFQDTPPAPEDRNGFVLQLQFGDTENGDAQPGDAQPRVDGAAVNLVDDINPDGSSQRPGPAADWNGAAALAVDLTPLGDTLFFSAYDPDHGRELWRTDGTPEGTGLVTDLVPGGDSRPQLLTAAGDTLFFTADHPDHGRELWRSDGTEAGTVLVTDVFPGLTSSPANMAAVGDVVFFDPLHPDHGTTSYEFAYRALWRSDGTAAGTHLVKDLNPDRGSQLRALTPVGDRLFFAGEPQTGNAELWVSDGTEGGTRSLTSIVQLRQLTAFGEGVLFNAEDERGRELWHSDGTEAGTGLVVDLNPEGSSIPLELSPVGEVAFFSAFGGTGEDDPHVPPSSVAPQDQHDDGAGRELWVTDGTEAGTSLVADINLGGSSHPEGMTAIGDTVVFAATGEQGRELWRTA